jgi:hypothetical protein
MTTYAVITREYEMYPQTDIEPAEYGADFIIIECEHKKDAKVLALKVLQSRKREYGARTFIESIEGECPFTGMKVIRHE